ncbi:hypothetical protein KR51_00018430 [Rubidibacter lacunae KORDI 51-2]|uniref:Uncharacterized protein n=1 Tax=Rubidibacter lacunae KORDI 51-2 TaxID=582515 RepID=U5DL78_9CHRO|nr:hypothetical protein [Rubidibacter lacunae]ERN41617.1 hypothetical protein KR51_00018430 [Rubidibacter lacunae KORDI 51-2]
MEIGSEKNQEISPEEREHLDRLKKLIERSLADGKLSAGELQAIRSFIQADGEVSQAEILTLRRTIRELLGGALLEFDWD